MQRVEQEPEGVRGRRRGALTSSMWFRKCTGVSATHFPVPSMPTVTSTCVSRVFRCTDATLSDGAAAQEPVTFSDSRKVHAPGS